LAKEKLWLFTAKLKFGLRFAANIQSASLVQLVQESGSFHTTQKVPKKSDFLEKSDFSNRVPKHAQKMKNKSGAQEIRFFGKIGFLKPCAQTCPRNEKQIRCPRNPIFWKNRISFEKTEFINGLDIGAILH
jgi:hypothetical protein